MPKKTDSEVEQWVLRALNLSEKVRSQEICVLARDGVASLRGSAQSLEDRLAVEEATRRATGVVGVVNELRVKPCTTRPSAPINSASTAIAEKHSGIGLHASC